MYINVYAYGNCYLLQYRYIKRNYLDYALCKRLALNLLYRAISIMIRRRDLFTTIFYYT